MGDGGGDDNNGDLGECVLVAVRGAADAGSSADISPGEADAPGEADGLLPVLRITLSPSHVFALAAVDLAGDQTGELGAKGERAPDGRWEVPVTRPRLGLW